MLFRGVLTLVMVLLFHFPAGINCWPLVSVLKLTHSLDLTLSCGEKFFFLFFWLCNLEFSSNASLCTSPTQISIYSALLLFVEDSINSTSLLRKIKAYFTVIYLAWTLSFGVQNLKTMRLLSTHLLRKRWILSMIRKTKQHLDL